VSIVVLIVILSLSMNRAAIQKALFPPKPLPATVAFGILPKFDLNFGNKPTGSITYTLQTVSDELPILPTTAKVFAMGQNKASFSTPDVIKEKAGNLNFATEPEISGTKMKFTDQKGRTLTADVISGNMKLITTYLNDPDILTTRPDSVEQVKKQATDFFETAGLNPFNYPENKIEIKYYRLDGGSLNETSSLSNANLVGINYQMGDIDKIPVYTVDTGRNSVFALASQKNLVEATFEPLNVDKGLFATYPLKDISLAYEELKTGNAVFNKPNNGSGLIVSSVSLGYLANPSASYLIPVYVFDLGNPLLAFVPAVDASWIQH